MAADQVEGIVRDEVGQGIGVHQAVGVPLSRGDPVRNAVFGGSALERREGVRAGVEDGDVMPECGERDCQPHPSRHRGRERAAADRGRGLDDARVPQRCR